MTCPAEKARCARFGWQCSVYMSISFMAYKRAKQKFGGSSKSQKNKKEAFRHMIWQAMLKLLLGHSNARAWGAAHEAGGTDRRDRQRDLWNNARGRRIANEVRQYNWWRPGAWWGLVQQKALARIKRGDYARV